MYGLDAHYAAQLDRHQAQIDRQDYKDIEREELELAAEVDFQRIALACDMSAPVPETEMPVHERIGDKYTKTGTRPLEFGELFYEYMDDKERANRLLRALCLCAAKGNIEAVEAVNEIKDLYVSDRVNKQLERES
jgi:hypothetical protein